MMRPQLPRLSCWFHSRLKLGGNCDILDNYLFRWIFKEANHHLLHATTFQNILLETSTPPYYQNNILYLFLYYSIKKYKNNMYFNSKNIMIKPFIQPTYLKYRQLSVCSYNQIRFVQDFHPYRIIMLERF